MSKIAFIVGPEFEDTELRVPFDRVREAGHEPIILGMKVGDELSGKKGKETVKVQADIATADPATFSAVVIPGGNSPDHLRTEKPVVDFVRRFAATGKPVAAICHGPQLLIDADATRGRTMTSWPSIRRDLENAGVSWQDKEVVHDGNFITSRKPADAEAFSKELLKSL